MRYFGAVRGTGRFASEDIEYRDVLFPAGTFIAPSMADGEPRPRRVRPSPRRSTSPASPPGQPQLTFGSGIHYCLGAALARAELQEALPILARRMPDLALDGHVTWKPNAVGIFGPEHLPVRFAAGTLTLDPSSGACGRQDPGVPRWRGTEGAPVDFELPADLVDFLAKIDDFIEREIKPLEQENDNIRFLDHRREDARTDWERGGLPEQGVGGADARGPQAGRQGRASTATRTRSGSAGWTAPTSGWPSSASTWRRRASGCTATCRPSTRSSATSSA